MSSSPSISKENNKVIPLVDQLLIESEYIPNNSNTIAQNNKKLISELTIKYNASNSFIEWCELLISLSPNILQNILDTISDIIIDDKIDVVDIPNIILLIVSNIQLNSKRYGIVCSEYMLDITKIIIHMIIDYELFCVSTILQNNIVVEAMINACLELILIDLNTKPNIPVIQENKTEFWDWLISVLSFWNLGNKVNVSMENK